jgi:hypothetical protein
MADTVIQKAVRGVKTDVQPTSDEHLARLILGSIMTVGAVLVAILHYLRATSAWNVTEAVVVGMLLVGGIGVMFTTTLLTILRAIPLPWGNKASAP